MLSSLTRPPCKGGDSASRYVCIHCCCRSQPALPVCSTNLFSFLSVPGAQAKDFGFTRVFSPSAGQAEAYESTMRPLVDDVFASQNALLFAYGMTNAGKTYTVLGEEGSPGLIPQALT